jgi:hypothetical protein
MLALNASLTTKIRYHLHDWWPGYYFITVVFWWLIAWARAWKYKLGNDEVFFQIYYGLVWPIRLLYLVIYELV